ncbi:uncharacterized protein LOC131634890 [Vicia villosa]|uniref:uncharacterized protein LOC131634890 n=1 Tax=Vicia villosa TaxID=3911 RepID=UPI00273C8338|nr:uncharacterized protein LOC131634890 [Vicia villosa]
MGRENLRNSPGKSWDRQANADILASKGEASDNEKVAETLKKIDSTAASKNDRKLWVDVLAENRNPAKGLSMQFVAPSVIDGGIEIEIEDDDIATEVKYWENALILYAMGEDLSMHMVKNFMEKAWNFIKLPELYYHDEGYFIIRFQSQSDLDAVLMKGPYTLRNIPLMLKEWKPDFNLKRDMLRTIPLWVKLPRLPLHLWGARSLSKIGSALGVPLVTDECTASKLRVSYARILVEVDITKELIKEITIKDCEGRKLQQPVEYEWKPLYCDRCKSIGHKCRDYVKKQWLPKGKPSGTTSSDPIQGTAAELALEKGKEGKTLPEEKESTHDQTEKGADDANWIEARSTIKERGKRILTGSSSDIACANGFEALGPDIVILIETRVKRDKAKNIRDKLHVHECYVDNYHYHDNGRIWISWNDSAIDVKVVNSSDQYIHCGIFDTNGTFLYWLTAIYGKNQLEQRKLLWKTITNIQPSIHEPWCLMGDFNNVLKAQDRIGGRLVTDSEFIDLWDMMNAAGLSEMDGCGDYYTWCNRHTNDTIYSRIDRLIGNVEWFKKYNEWTLRILAPNVSDHALLHVVNDTQNIVKKRRFKFYNCLTDIAGYEETVQKSWIEPLTGNPMYILWSKLQRLKPSLMKLGNNISNIKQNLVIARRNLEQAQSDLSMNKMDKNALCRVKQCTEDLIRLQEIEDKILLQKSKITWLRLSDENNAYFHATVKAKHKMQCIKMLKKEDGSYATDHEDIKDEVMQFYTKLMGTRAGRLKMIDVEAMRYGKQFTPEHGAILTRDVTEDAIWKALQGIGDSKAPGLDGYGAKFFKTSWSIVKDDVVAAVKYFFTRGKLFRAFNSTVVTLIPKHDQANEVRDFRPIAGCTTVYKIISKVLTNRLGSMLHEVIHHSQAAFLKGQLIHNHILLAFELMKGYNRRGGPPRCMLQIDLQKAYDMVDWSSLQTIMAELGIPGKFINWIMLGTASVTYRFKVNGDFTEIVEAKRGIRQGDPISPLLFVIMMEYLNRVLAKMSKNSHFKYHSKCSKLNITHLSFADDVLLFCRGDQSIDIMLEAFNSFSESTGLIMNPKKCKAFFCGMDTEVKQDILLQTGFIEGQFPIRYLGIPLASKRLNIHHYLPLIDRIVSRIRHWTANLLSIAGRIQLVKSVVVAITQYWMHCLPLPKAVLKKIDSICRTFIWSGKATQGKKSPVAWKQVCRPLKAGGLNILNLHTWNSVAMLKNLWAICMKGDNLWVKWVHTYFLKGRDPMIDLQTTNCTWILKHILDNKAEVHKILTTWNQMINQGVFHMTKVYKAIIGEANTVDWYHMLCHSIARPRAKMILWLAIQDRLPTKYRLYKLGMIQHQRCELCDGEDESIDHLLFRCPQTVRIWNDLLQWLDIKDTYSLNFEWMKKITKGKGVKRSILKAVSTEGTKFIIIAKNFVLEICRELLSHFDFSLVTVAESCAEAIELLLQAPLMKRTLQHWTCGRLEDGLEVAWKLEDELQMVGSLKMKMFKLLEASTKLETLIFKGETLGLKNFLLLAKRNSRELENFENYKRRGRSEKARMKVALEQIFMFILMPFYREKVFDDPTELTQDDLYDLRFRWAPLMKRMLQHWTCGRLEDGLEVAWKLEDELQVVGSLKMKMFKLLEASTKLETLIFKGETLGLKNFLLLAKRNSRELENFENYKRRGRSEKARMKVALEQIFMFTLMPFYREKVFDDPTELTQDDLYDLRFHWAKCFFELHKD